MVFELQVYVQCMCDGSTSLIVCLFMKNFLKVAKS